MQSKSRVRASCVLVPTALYRHWDKDGALLYIGISLNTMARLSQHKRTSCWFYEIARMDIEWHASRELAEAAERVAIVAERPKHNVIHASGIPVALWDMIKDHPLAKYVDDNGILSRDCPPLSIEDIREIADRLS